MELLVVLIILVALSALIIPRIVGVSDQANSSTSANILAAVNRAVQQFEAQQSKMPDTWDYVLDESDSPFKLNPKVSGLVTTHVLTADQAASLRSAGLNGGHTQSSTAAVLPHLNVDTWKLLAAGRTVLKLVKPATFGGHYVDFPDRAFGINKFKPEGFASEYVVFGLAGPTSLRGTAIMESPILQAAEPEKYYSRVLVVFRVPGAGQASFKAQYIGCFGPDGTTINDNIDNYHKSVIPPG